MFTRFGFFCSIIVVLSISAVSEAFGVNRFNGVAPRDTQDHAIRPSMPSIRYTSLFAASSKKFPSESAISMKETLVSSVKKLREYLELDGEFSVDFGVKGGELNATNRAPQTLSYYGISERVGMQADRVLQICDELSKESPTEEPTKFLGDKENGPKCPLNGPWKLLFTNAADASFSKNSKRGAARVQNVVNASKGRITNVIDFLPQEAEDGSGTTKKPVLAQLNVVIKASAASKSRVELQFKYAKAVLTKFFFFPLFGKKLALYIPVPAPFITRCIVFFSRIFRFGRKSAKAVPKAYFDVLYLDNDLRIHRTGDGNTFVQAKETWDLAKPLIE